jgi:hypothetical protein
MAINQSTREQVIERMSAAYAEGVRYYTDFYPELTTPSAERIRLGVAVMLDRMRYFDMLEECYEGFSIIDTMKRMRKRDKSLQSALSKIARETSEPNIRLMAREALRLKME